MLRILWSQAPGKDSWDYYSWLSLLGKQSIEGITVHILTVMVPRFEVWSLSPEAEL